MRDVREFVVEDSNAYQVGQTLDVSLFEAGESVDITGVSKGKSFSGTIKRHHFKRGPETHGSDSHRQPDSIGGGTTPGKVFKGTPMSGHMGNDRTTVKGATILQGRCGARAPARQGTGAGRTQRAHPGQEGLAMSVTTTLYTKAGAEAGTVDLPEALFAAPVNTSVLHQAVIAQLAGRRTGTRTPRPAARSAAVAEALPPEGHRPRPTGHPYRTPLRGGGVVFGPHPRSYVQKLPKRMRRLALQGALTSKFTDGAIKFVDDLTWMPSRPASSWAISLRSRHRAGCSWSSPARMSGWSCRHATFLTHSPGRLAQRGRHPERRHAGHHAAVHRHDGGGLRMTLQASQVILRPVISEKSMDETQRHKYTFAVHDDANKLQIAAAVAELFKVTVLEVNVSNTKPKEKSRNRKRGRIKGYTSPWKKAVVTVKSTDKVEFFEGV